MNAARTRFADIILRHAGALVIVFLATLLLRAANRVLGIQIIALLYLVPVILATYLWGLTPGVLAGFSAFLVFNFFFIPPYYTFVVQHPQDLITLIIFLVVAVVMSQIIGQAREGMATARAREWEATRMYELISSLSGMHDYPAIAQRLASHTQETFQAVGVEVHLDWKSTSESYSVYFPETFTPSDRPTLRVRGFEGEIRLWMRQMELERTEMRLLETFASQGALSLERVRLAEAESRTRVLEESDRLKSSLLSSVSHELRTPLASIKASVTSLHSGEIEWQSATRQELLEVIEEETDHLDLLVSNLLDMTRLEAGALRPVKKWNSLLDILNGVTKKMRATLSRHTVALDIPSNLPLLPTDYMQMEQVFTNLFSNSAKYAPQGSEIRIQARTRPNQMVLIRVINQGPPVPEEDLEKIFDKFHRITMADQVTGTGLGLSICKGIIQAHGGKIWAENSKEGFTFALTLPITMDGSLPMVPKESSLE